MEYKVEEMRHMKKIVEKCLGDLMKKEDLTPAETKAAIDGFHLHDELCCRIEDCENEEKGMKRTPDSMMENGYSGHGDPYREYHITSYGMPERAVYSDRSYGNMHRNAMNYSEGPQYGVHGWYQNDYQNLPGYPVEHMRGGYYGSERSDTRGYSRHSISDRAVSCLEQLFDSSASDYEKQELKKYIALIRNAGMND